MSLNAKPDTGIRPADRRPGRPGKALVAPILTAVFCCGPLTSAHAAVTLYTTIESFIQATAASATPVTDALITDAPGIIRASEVSAEPGINNGVGNTLTFNGNRTPFDFNFRLTTVESGAGFTFDDEEPPAPSPANFDHALSVGDIDNDEDDDWVLTILNGNTSVVAAGFTVRDNDFETGTTETLTVKNTSGSTLATFDLSALGLGFQASQFLGVIATGGDHIGSIEFDEDSGGDDIAIADFRFGLTPESPAQAMINTRSSHAAIVTLDNRVLITGGNFGEQNSRNKAEWFDPANGSFTAATDMLQGRFGHTVTMLPDGNILVVGGIDSPSTVLNHVEIFDVANNEWRPGPPTTLGRNNHTATRLLDGRVLVAGGQGGNGNTYEIYDPATDSWSAPQTFGVSDIRSRHSAALAQDGRVWVTGGIVNASESATTIIYDPDTDNWSSGPAMNEARETHISTLLSNGYLAVVGNDLDGSNMCTSGSLELVDTNAGTPSWDNSAASPNINKCNPVGGLLADGSLYVAASRSTATDEIEVYDFDNDRWNMRLTGFADLEISTSTMLLTGKLLLMSRAEPVIAWLGYDHTTNVGSLVDNRDVVSSAIFGNGNILVAGGDINGVEIVNGNSLANSEDCPNCLSGHDPDQGMTLTALETSGKSAMVGGFSAGGGYSGDILVFDPLDNAMFPEIVQGELIVPRAFHRASVLNDGRILIIGGTPAEANSTAELYDPRTNATHQTGALNSPRQQNHDSIVLRDGRVLVAGGLGFSDSPETYNPAVNQWTETPPLNTPRNSVRLAMLHDGRVLAAGGSTGLASQAAEIFDPGSNTWIPTASMHVARQNFVLVTLANGLVLAAGGTASGTSTEIYDPATGQWTLTSPLPLNTVAASAVNLGDNRVAIIGGASGSASEGMKQVYQWNALIPFGGSFPSVGWEGEDITDEFFINVNRPVESASSGTSSNSEAHNLLLFIRRFDGTDLTWLKPEPDANWLAQDGYFQPVNGLPTGPVWLGGFYNGSPLKPTSLTIPFLPVEEQFCVPLTTTGGRVVLVCI